MSIKNGRSSYFPFIHIAAKILHFRFDLHSVLGHLVTVRPMTPSWVVQTMFDPLSLLDVRFLEHEIYCITLSIPPTTDLTSNRIISSISVVVIARAIRTMLQHLYARALVLIGRPSDISCEDVPSVTASHNIAKGFRRGFTRFAPFLGLMMALRACSRPYGNIICMKN